jgi:hypothetical protein
VTEFGIAYNRPGKSSASFRRGQSDPRPLTKTGWQQLSGYGNAKNFEIVGVCDLKWLCRIYDGKIRRPSDLLMVALRIATNAFQLQIDKA